MSLLGLANGFLRHRWLVAGLSLTAPVIVIMATIVASPTWTATASFMPQTGAEGAASQLAALAGQFGVNIQSEPAGGSPRFYADLLTSREVLGALARDTFTLVEDTATGRTRRGTLADLRGLEVEDPDLRRASTIGWLRTDAIDVTPGPETGVIELEVTTPWRDVSTQVAARLVEQVNQFNLETRQTQAAEERRFIEGRVREAREELRAAENELESFLRNNRQFRNSPELTFQHDRLQREVAMRQQVYTSLVQAYEQARVSEVRNTPVITVIEEAEAPVTPDSKRIPLKAALAFVLGGTVATLVAFAREYAIRSREEGSDDYEEFRSLWRDTVGDFKHVLRKVRPATGDRS